MTTVDTWVELLKLPPDPLTPGRVFALHRLVDAWGRTSELAAIERGEFERVHRRYVAQAVRQDIPRPRPGVAPLLERLRTSDDPRAAAIEFYSSLPSPARYVRGPHDLGRFWAEWWRHPDDERYRANLEAVSQLVATTIGRRDIRELIERAMMHA